jgi:hypothetical protein
MLCAFAHKKTSLLLCKAKAALSQDGYMATAKNAILGRQEYCRICCSLVLLSLRFAVGKTQGKVCAVN